MRRRLTSAPAPRIQHRTVAHRFDKHYTLEEARTLLPQLRTWLNEIKELRHDLARHEKRLGGMMKEGDDLGGDLVNNWMRALAGLQKILVQFQRRRIQIKDLDRGLVDFPAIIGGREVFLCWEQDEDEIEFWHDLDTGYGGREKI